MKEAVHKGRTRGEGEESAQSGRGKGGARDHADVRKTADNLGQIRSKSHYLWCKNCVSFACKTHNFVLTNNTCMRSAIWNV